MDPHAKQPTSLHSLIAGLWRNRQLIALMTKRDVLGRYKGSVIGLLWSFFNPLVLLIMYTFVFSQVFKARWGSGGETKTQFALVLFVGLIVHGLFSEVLNRAPGLILSNARYVKKIVFPLEIFPVMALGASLFHALVSVLVFLAAFVLIHGHLQWTMVYLPLVLFPLLALTLGLAWGLASLGVFLRDAAQPTGLVMTLLLFASPVFYPATALPEHLRPWLMLNPLTLIIEQSRATLIFGMAPDWAGLAIYSAASVVILWAGYAWFQKTRKGFANVL